jgi:putative nucleotidyltransferase with HDIG domain
MREIGIEELVIGDCLSKDVYNDLGNIILSQGTEITKRHIDYFKKHSIDYVYLDEMDSESSILSNYELQTFNDLYANMIDIYKSLYFQVKAKQYAFDAITLQSDIKPLVDHVLLDNDVLQCLRHVNVSEEYYIKHAVNVSVLAAITAKWMNMDSETIYSVALAGLLHDIGKALVDHNILFKPDRLSAYEMSNMKEHSKFGYEVIKNNPTVPREVLAAVLFHHERSDGNGYPSGLTEEQTPFLARIIAVADVFDAITSDRVYKEKVSSFKAFSIIKDESFRGLDPRVCEVFLSNIATFFVNNRVKLNDGRIGDVVYINKYALNRPLVRVNNEFVDLSMDYSVDIEDVL